VLGWACLFSSVLLHDSGLGVNGDAVSHAVMPGVVLAYILKIPFAIGAFVFGVSSVLAIGFIKSKPGLRTVIGLVFTGFFAFGLVLISKTPSTVDLTHILFGNVLGISNQDIIQTVLIAAITLVTILVLRKIYCFSVLTQPARSIGLNTVALYYILLSVLSLTIVAALQTGYSSRSHARNPGATAYLLTDRFDHMMLIAAASGVFSSVMGYISYHIDGATGGCIVVLQTLIFVGVIFLLPSTVY